MKWAILLIALLPFFGCSAVPTPPPVDLDAGSPEAAPEADPDAALACFGPADCACKNLCSLECATMCDPGCEAAVEQVLKDRMMVFSTDCAIEAKSKEMARACPGIRCE